MSTAKPAATARERLLAAADELFYDEGVHTVGIDRVIARAGVAKASLYTAFGSKEELVRAYLAQRLEERKQRVARRIAEHARPRERILAIFDLIAERALEPTFRGCPFINASAEGSREETAARRVVAEARAWLRGLLVELARDAGAADPEALGRRLHVLYDGAVVGAALERDPRPAREARETAALLIDAAGRRTRRRAKPR